ncbi:MAG: hemerythrin domain-containing protein [Alphaproteobacteria bacterium]|nr:hemerythrin domain-containing protein [Alphaproteobacteria bacterium]
MDDGSCKGLYARAVDRDAVRAAVRGAVTMSKPPRDSDNVVELRQRRRAADFRNPLDFFRKEHDRGRSLCRRLRTVVDTLPDRPDQALATELIVFLREDLPMHVADEEQCLFPMLRARSLVGDPVDEWVRQLCEEHAADLTLSARIAGLLADVLRPAPDRVPDAVSRATRELAVAAHRFAECKYRHALWEDIVILPHAELRFSASDWYDLGDQLSARRNFKNP